MPGRAVVGAGIEEFAADDTSSPLAFRMPAAADAEPSIEQLYNNVCEMASSSDGGDAAASPSQESFCSDGEESRIDSELRHLVGGEMDAIKAIEKEDDAGDLPVSTSLALGPAVKSLHSGRKPKKPSKSPEEVEKVSTRPAYGKRQKGGSDEAPECGLDNLDLGPFLLKRARDLVATENPRRALKYALRAARSFEKCCAAAAEGNQQPALNLAMSLHVVAAIYCNLGQYGQAVPLLRRSLELPSMDAGQDHALAKFSGYMQLGDTYGMLGQLESSLQCYNAGLEVQKQALSDTDPRVAETCRYLAEAYVQAIQLNEAQRLCQAALDIHRANGEPGSPEETADRRLMGLIFETKGDHESALEHLVLASMALVANGQEAEVATVDASIGDIYLSLGRYDEAVFSYQKALTVFKAGKGENHPTVASVFVRLADLYHKTGKLRESKSYCENALRIYQKPIPGTLTEDIAAGLADVAAIYESMGDYEQATRLLQKALKTYNGLAGHQSTVAGIEAQMGVLHYVSGNYAEAYTCLKSATEKLQACGEKKSGFLGIALNQMGLVCVQRYAIDEAAALFEEARSILEREYGPYHPDTLGVYSNLAGTYDAMGRVDEAIQILEHIVGMREERLGTANPDVDDEKRRLAELLREAGKARSRKAKSLENLLENNPHAATRKATAAVAS